MIDELMRPMSQFDAWMLTVCLRVGFFVPIAMPATVLGVLCWVVGEYVGRRDSEVHKTTGATKMSDQEPVAWIVDIDGSTVDHIYAASLEAEQLCDWHLTNFPHVNARIVPLYRLPTLTNDERAAIAYGVASLQSAGNYEIFAKDTLRKLLERLKPAK